MSVGGFVPKAHTPFQWFGQNGVDELHRKVGMLRDELGRKSGVQLKWHDPEATFAEGIVSRGDRRIGRVIERVWRAGGTFQEWSERFDLAAGWTRWRPRASTPTGTSPGTAPRTRSCRGTTSRPGLHKDFLWQDWQAALAEHGLPDCRWTPATTAGCAPTTRSSTSSRPPSPRPAAARGTGQDLSTGGDVPVLLPGRRS